MTDKDIIKALEICRNENGMCSDCPYSDDYTNCNTRIAKDVLDIINRQKAEVERLREETAELIDDRYATQLLCHLIKKEDDTRNVRSDAIKEFADRLISVSHPYADTQMVFEIQIKNLVKEMVGDNNAE